VGLPGGEVAQHRAIIGKGCGRPACVPVLMVGAAGAAPTRPATAPPVGASPASIASRYLFCGTQSVND
jgi:hypothetical protein